MICSGYGMKLTAFIAQRPIDSLKKKQIWCLRPFCSTRLWQKPAGSPAQTHLLAQLLIARAGTGAERERLADAQRALGLLDQPNLPSQSNAILDLKVRAIIESGKTEQARPLIEYLARHGYRSPDYLQFLQTAHRDTP